MTLKSELTLINNGIHFGINVASTGHAMAWYIVQSYGRELEAFTLSVFFITFSQTPEEKLI
jgi:hypothetical protein